MPFDFRNFLKNFFCYDPVNTALFPAVETCYLGHVSARMCLLQNRILVTVML
jgi:hypothetical protein